MRSYGLIRSNSIDYTFLHVHVKIFHFPHKCIRTENLQILLENFRQGNKYT